VIDLYELWKEVRDRRNVVAASLKLRPKISGEKYVGYEAFKVYVSRKLPVKALHIQDVVPTIISGVPTDVEEIGEMYAVPPGPLPALEYVERVRPLVAGFSIGNWAITAGTHGWYFENGEEVALGSNAHVFADDPTNPKSEETRIVQPGRHDGGNIPKDIASEYLWHQQLYGGPSMCPVAGATARLLNIIGWSSGARTRFRTFTEGVNRIDFAVSRPTVDYDVKLHMAEENTGFVGLGFAGSDLASFVCKARYIEETGWRPVDRRSETAVMGDWLHGVGRSSEYTKALVRDDSVVGKVQYGAGVEIEFDDIILTWKMLSPGDSGISAWKHLEVKDS